MLTIASLKSIFPTAARTGRADGFNMPLNAAMVEFEINTNARMAAFLSQIGVESAELRYVKELWGPTEQQNKYEPPHPLAQRLGNILQGDGYRYRGRGLIQITGRSNYAACGKGLGLDLIAEPELLEQQIHACRSAGWYWKVRNINAAADRGDIAAVTRLVNGGLTAFEERKAYYERAKAVLM